VHGLDGQRDLGRVQARARLAELAVFLKPEEELTSCHVVQHHVEFVGGLERVYKVHEEGAVYVLQDRALGGRVRQLVPLYERSFAERFEGVELACGVVLLLHEHHLTERALAEHLRG